MKILDRATSKPTSPYPAYRRKISKKKIALNALQMAQSSTYTYPDGFTLVIDTREQKPLFTDVDVPKITTVIHNGDYSVKGFEDRIAFERKGVSDFFGYIGAEREKTITKLERLSLFDFAFLVVEASLDDILAPQIYTKLTANHVLGFLCTLDLRYNIGWFFHRDRKMIERFILDRAIKYYKMIREI